MGCLLWVLSYGPYTCNYHSMVIAQIYWHDVIHIYPGNVLHVLSIIPNLPHINKPLNIAAHFKLAVPVLFTGVTYSMLFYRTPINQYWSTIHCIIQAALVFSDDITDM